MKAWGSSSWGGTDPGLTSGVVTIVSTYSAFAALKTDGSVKAWVSSETGGADPGLTSGVVTIFSTREAFAALKTDGSVKVWGRSEYGGTDPGLTSGVVTIFLTYDAFAALKTDGSVKAWGNPVYGGTDPGLTSGVVTIFSNNEAFAALGHFCPALVLRTGSECNNRTLLYIVMSSFCVLAIASFVLVLKDPIDKGARGRLLFQSTMGVWDFGSDLFYVGTSYFVSDALFWCAISAMVVPSIVFVLLNLKPVKAHIVGEGGILSKLFVQVIGPSIVYIDKTAKNILNRLHYSPGDNGKIEELYEAIIKLLSLLAQLIVSLVLYSLLALFSVIIVVPGVIIVFNLTIVGLIVFINFKLGACAWLTKWFLMTEDEDNEAFTYVFNSGVMVEIFLESIPQIVIINLNTWRLGERGGFAHYIQSYASLPERW